MVERHLAKVEVAGSSPVIRSKEKALRRKCFSLFFGRKGLEPVPLCGTRVLRRLASIVVSCSCSACPILLVLLGRISLNSALTVSTLLTRNPLQKQTTAKAVVFLVFGEIRARIEFLLGTRVLRRLANIVVSCSCSACPILLALLGRISLNSALTVLTSLTHNPLQKQTTAKAVVFFVFGEIRARIKFLLGTRVLRHARKHSRLVQLFRLPDTPCFARARQSKQCFDCFDFAYP